MPRGIWERTEAFRIKMSKKRKGICFNTGKTHFNKGSTPWNKEKKGCFSIKVRIKMSNSHKKIIGKNHPRWKGGKIIDGRYYFILNPSHPNANSKGYIGESRLVMEKYLGRYLKPLERIHHLDRNPLNNKIKNLRLFPNHKKHMLSHWKDPIYSKHMSDIHKAIKHP